MAVGIRGARGVIAPSQILSIILALFKSRGGQIMPTIIILAPWNFRTSYGPAQEYLALPVIALYGHSGVNQPENIS